MRRRLRARITTAALPAALAATALAAVPASGHAATVQTFPVAQQSAGLNTLVRGPGGNLYFSESNASGGAYHIGSISPSGQFGPATAVPVGEYDSSGEGPRNLVSSGGSLWFTSSTGNVIYRYAPGGSLVPAFGDPNDPGDADSTTTLGPSAGGGVWATDSDGFDQPNGDTDLRRFAANAGPGSTPAYVPATYGAIWLDPPLVLGPSGRIWYSDDGDYLRATSDAGVTQSFPISGIPLGAPNAIAFDRKGDLWFTSEYPGTGFTSPDEGTTGELPAGGSSATATALPDGDVPTSIARGPDGNMYFGWFVGPSTSGPKGGIGKIDTATGKVTLASLGGFQPGSVTFTPDGKLWFIDSGLNQVDRVDVSQLFPAAGGGGGGGGHKLPRAPKLTLAVPHQRLAGVRSHKRLKATCKLAGAGRCAVRATIPHATARKLKLVKQARPARSRKRKPAKPYTLASASRRLKHKGKVTLTLRLSAKEARALHHVKRVKLTLAATSSAAKHRSRTARRTITLK